MQNCVRFALIPITHKESKMRLFGRKNQAQRCSDCRFYALVEGKGFCSKDVPAHVNVRLLSSEGVKRQCSPCPAEMTCASWVAKA